MMIFSKEWRDVFVEPLCWDLLKVHCIRRKVLSNQLLANPALKQCTLVAIFTHFLSISLMLQPWYKLNYLETDRERCEMFWWFFKKMTGSGHVESCAWHIEVDGTLQHALPLSSNRRSMAKYKILNWSCLVEGSLWNSRWFSFSINLFINEEIKEWVSDHHHPSSITQSSSIYLLIYLFINKWINR